MPKEKPLAALIIAHSMKKPRDEEETESKEESYAEADPACISAAEDLIKAVKSGNAEEVADILYDLHVLHDKKLGEDDDSEEEDKSYEKEE
jgi:hypothetical protein